MGRPETISSSASCRAGTEHLRNKKASELPRRLFSIREKRMTLPDSNPAWIRGR